MAKDFLETPIGLLKIEAEDDAVTGITAAESIEKCEPSGLTEEAKRQLTEYFSGKRAGFTFPVRQKGTGFMQTVFAALREIPYGKTVSYGQLAKYIGRPKAARAVGMAAHRNRLLIVVPCHRLTAANGIGGFALGIDKKRRLLELEKRASEEK